MNAGSDGRGGTDAVLVRRLIAAQFPQWRDRPVTAVPVDGRDNRTYRVAWRPGVVPRRRHVGARPGLGLVEGTEGIGTPEQAAASRRVIDDVITDHDRLA